MMAKIETSGDSIRAKAKELGFDAVGFLEAASDEGLKNNLKRFLQKGYHGDMTWLDVNFICRSDPLTLWPEAKSIITLGMNYTPANAPLDLLARPNIGNISVYARGADYHETLKKRLKQLAGWIVTTFECEVKVFVDTAPLMEKPLAKRGGIGWQGKHTNLVSTRHGSWLFLGEILTTLNLPPDTPETDHCGVCQACLDICPTKAFPKPYELDARRCISYLTIEHKGVIPPEFRRAIGNRIYGCDDCLAVCPWNKFAQQTEEYAFRPRAELISPELVELVELDDATFRRRFNGSAIKRIGRDRFLRNVLIALGNSGDSQVVPAVERRLSDISPLVRGMAVWALRRLIDTETFAALHACHAPYEEDAEVLKEWAV